MSFSVCDTGCSPMSDFVARKKHLERLIAEWESFATPTADQHAPQQTYLADLKQTRLGCVKKGACRERGNFHSARFPGEFLRLSKGHEQAEGTMGRDRRRN